MVNLQTIPARLSCTGMTGWHLRQSTRLNRLLCRRQDEALRSRASRRDWWLFMRFADWVLADVNHYEAVHGRRKEMNRVLAQNCRQVSKDESDLPSA